MATLDLIICPEWDGRYYSFNSEWSPTEEMASMRNGCGDEWFLLFDSSGKAALKGLAHEAPAAAIEGFSSRLQDAVPDTFKDFATGRESAFSWDDTSFCYWHVDDETGWEQPREQEGVETGASELLSIITSGAVGYQSFASEYYEQDFELPVIKQVFEHCPMTERLLSSLNPELSLEDVCEDLAKVGYPH